jgi:RNA polymerase sigma-70 factor, ECF subfamily
MKPPQGARQGREGRRTAAGGRDMKAPQNYRVACCRPSGWVRIRNLRLARVRRAARARVPTTDSDTLVRLLAAARQGDADALNELAPLVYDELRRIARRQMRNERQGHTLQPTALANEAWARLMGARRLEVQNRAHFMAIAANAMRQILVERARAHRAAKRGGAAHQVTLDEAMLPGGVRPIDIEALDEALARLEAHNPELARIVELRFFGGLTVEETADQLDSSPATVKRRWTLAKAWLLRELEGRQST